MYHPRELPNTADLIREGEAMRARLRSYDCTCITCARLLKQAESMLSTLKRLENAENMAVQS